MTPETTAPEITQSLDELACAGARRMIAEALKLEADEYVEKLRDLRDAKGHALVVARSCERGNGKAKPRTVTLAMGPIEIEAPRVYDRRPGHKYTRRILPPYRRRAPRLDEALPARYLHGLSTEDFSDALSVLLGPEVAGLSPPRPSRGCCGCGKMSTVPGARARWPGRITCMYGPMGCTSGCASKTTAWRAWCSWGCSPTARRR